MTKIEVIQKNLCAVMIDGYVAPEDTLKEAVTKLSRILGKSVSYVKSELYHYFRNDKQLSENLNLLFFRRLVKEFREIYCPYKLKKKTEHRGTIIIKPCHYRFFTTKPNQYSIETFLSQGPKYEKKGIEHVLLILQKEFEKDIKFERLRYAQNLILYSKCEVADKCCQKWIKELNFRIKNSNEYENYSSFKSAWVDYLNHTLARYLTMIREGFFVRFK